MSSGQKWRREHGSSGARFGFVELLLEIINLPQHLRPVHLLQSVSPGLQLVDFGPVSLGIQVHVLQHTSQLYDAVAQ